MGVLVGKQAPDFTSGAVLANGEIVDEFNLHSAIKGKKAVIFFYPLDFTFVCPSELIAFDHRIEEFKKRNVEVIGGRRRRQCDCLAGTFRSCSPFTSGRPNARFGRRCQHHHYLSSSLLSSD